MLVSHKYKFVFIHNPRTGGTSIRTALMPHLGPEDITGLQSYPYYLHATASELRKTLGRKLWRQYYTFAFVRNPWDKLVSQFSFFSQTKDMEQLLPDFHQKFNDTFKNFDDWCHYLAANNRRSRWWLHQLVKRISMLREILEKIIGKNFNMWCKVHPLPWFANTRFVTGASRRSMLDFVGRYESLDNDFKRVCEAIGLDISLPHVNKTRYIDYRAYYTDETRELIGKVFKKDIQFFGYRF